MRIKTLWDVTLRAAQDWWEDNCLRLAASLAYYTALSLAPLLLLMVGLLGLVLGREQVARQLAVQLESLMDPAGREGKRQSWLRAIASISLSVRLSMLRAREALSCEGKSIVAAATAAGLKSCDHP